MSRYNFCMTSAQKLTEIFALLWKDYSILNPQAQAIHKLLEGRGETVINDHVAFRTYNDPRIGLEVLAKAFKKYGYVEKDTYHFEEKKLLAKYYQHEDPKLPKVFISELLTEKFSSDVQKVVQDLIQQIDIKTIESDFFSVSGRPWKVDYIVYDQLSAISEYAAWMAAFGFRANHFTVNFNQLKSFNNLTELNEFLKANGFKLNSSGGEIKGTPAECLEQSSTLAAQVDCEFSDGTHKIPSCYYEFARRYPTKTGELYPGFIAASADKIFESTDRKAR